MKATLSLLTLFLFSSSSPANAQTTFLKDGVYVATGKTFLCAEKVSTDYGKGLVTTLAFSSCPYSGVTRKFSLASRNRYKNDNTFIVTTDFINKCVSMPQDEASFCEEHLYDESNQFILKENDSLKVSYNLEVVLPYFYKVVKTTVLQRDGQDEQVLAEEDTFYEKVDEIQPLNF